MRNIKPDPEKLKIVVDEMKVGLKAEKKSPDEIASALLNKVRYGSMSQYLNRLTLAETKKLKSEDLISEFKSVLKVECSIHYCGNLSLQDVSDKISNKSTSTKGVSGNDFRGIINVDSITTPSLSPIYRPSSAVEEPIIYFIDLPKTSQSIIYGYLQGGVNTDIASRHAGALFNNYFGGSMSSLVFQQIREFRSMAYRANARYNLPSYKFRDKEGVLVASLSTQCDKTTDAIGVLDSLIRFMPAKAERVETARQDVINEATNQYPPLRSRSSQIADLKKLGYSSDPNKDLAKAVAEMGMDDIIAFYNKNIEGRPISYLVVGNAKKIDMAKLATYGKIVKFKPSAIFK